MADDSPFPTEAARRVLERLYDSAIAGSVQDQRTLVMGYAGDDDAMARFMRLVREENQ